MEHTFDELVGILKSPQSRLEARYGAIVLRLAESLGTGIAIGVGIAVGRVLAG